MNPSTLATAAVDLPLPLAEEGLYISPPWIDSHSHVYHGGVGFALHPDQVGWRTGVHLLVDAGCAGAEAVEGFVRYLLPTCKTKVLAFLNISTVGLTTMREHYDLRNLDVQRAADCCAQYPGFLLGIKVRSSGTIVEERGIAPARLAAQAARQAGLPMMMHMGENPPTNEENLELLEKGDILTHCFHGKEKPLWNPDGSPIPALEKALERGVLLDVGHGAASLSRDIAAAVVATGFHRFSISTDLHTRSIGTYAVSLPHIMSKFLAFGMSLEEVIRAVTSIPAARLNLHDWCDNLGRNATVFRLRPPGPQDKPFLTPGNQEVAVREVIEPVGVLMDGEWTPCNAP